MQLGPTMTSYDACTAARRVPCLEAWPAAVFASANILLKSFSALSTLKRCTRASHYLAQRLCSLPAFATRTPGSAAEHADEAAIAADLWPLLRRRRCRLRPRTRRLRSACMTAAAACSQAPSTATGRHCGARHRRDAAPLPTPSPAPLPPPSATTDWLCWRRRPSRCCVDYALLRPEARWVRRAPQTWLSSSEAAARGLGGRPHGSRAPP